MQVGTWYKNFALIFWYLKQWEGAAGKNRAKQEALEAKQMIWVNFHIFSFWFLMMRESSECRQEQIETIIHWERSRRGQNRWFGLFGSLNHWFIFMSSYSDFWWSEKARQSKARRVIYWEKKQKEGESGYHRKWHSEKGNYFSQKQTNKQTQTKTNNDKQKQISNHRANG